MLCLREGDGVEREMHDALDSRVEKSRPLERTSDDLCGYLGDSLKIHRENLKTGHDT